MKTNKIILTVLANAVAAWAIILVINRSNMVNKYADRFKPNSFIMCDSIVIESSPEALFHFYKHDFHKYYSEMAEKHHEFKLLNSDSIIVGTEIFCKEGTNDEMVYHKYIVQEVAPNKLLYWSSEPSTVHTKTPKGIRKNYCNAFVYMDFDEIEKNRTKLRLTIAVQMPNYFYKLLGRIIGGKAAKEEWESHVKEELVGLRDIFYKTTKNTL